MNPKQPKPCFKVINLEESEDCSHKDCSHHLENSLFKQLGITSSLLHSRTPFCKHDLGCIENTLNDSTRSFIYGYAMRMAVSLITLALKILKKSSAIQIKAIKECLLSKENLTFGAFMGLMSMTLKGLICLMRKIRKKEDWKNSFIPGAIAGYLNLFFIDKGHRVSFATFFLSRAFDSCYNSLVNRKVIKKSQLNYVVIFMFLNVFTVYARSHEPYILPRSLANFYNFVFQRNSTERVLESVMPAITSQKMIRRSLGIN